MTNKIKNILPWAALAAAILMAVLFMLGNNQRTEKLVDTGETRAYILPLVSTITAAPYDGTNASNLLKSVQQLSNEKFMAKTVLVDSKGEVLYFKGGRYNQELFHLDERVTADTQRVLAALPADLLNDEQRMQIKISSALQADGDHNDVFQYRVFPIKDQSGRSTAYLGVAYDISSGVGAAPSLLDAASLILLFLSAMVYWLALPAWVFLDARQRGEKSWIWALFTLIGNLAALMAYFLVRSPKQEISK